MTEQLAHPTEILAEDIDRFYQDIESLLNTLPIIMVVIDLLRKASHDELTKFIDEHALEKELLEDVMRFKIDIEDLSKSKELKQKSNNFMNAYKLIPRHYIISLVSQFDSFLGRIIRFIFSVQPELLNTSEKTLSYSDILQFPDIPSAKEYLIEKEIEAVLRKSHADQFDWLKQKLGIPFNKDLECWSVFIELTERRNLFVHANGRVTSQYISVCRQNNCVIPLDLKVGDQLKVSKEYFERAFMCICEIGYKMAQVIWRRLSPETLEGADTNLMEFTLDMINKRMYELAINILEFFTRREIKHFNEVTRRVMIINKAQAYKWSGDNEKCLRIIGEEDWSLSTDNFKIALATLREEYDACYGLMKNLTNDTKFHKTFYNDWPLFKHLREQPEFKIVYEECYKEQFVQKQAAKIKYEISLPSKRNDKDKNTK